MKKILIIFITILVVSTLIFIFPKKEKNNTIKVAEVTHSIFYAPQYIAIKNGYFKEENIDIELILTPGADKVTASILSGDVDIGLCGIESTIYVYNSGEDDYLVSFAQLTKKDGSFIVSRNKIDNFTLKDLEGAHVIAGRSGGMPLMMFNYILKENNINNVYVDSSIAFNAMDGSFIGGVGDFVNLFEPNASNIEREGYGYVVSSLSKYTKDVPYTVYNARKSFINENEDLINGFKNAINKGLKYVYETDSSIVASILYDYFPDMSLNELIKSIDNYKNENVWNETTYLSEESFKNIEDIMIYNEVLENYVSYSDLVKN